MASVTNTLVVASYNLHGCVGTDGRRDVHRIARVIRDTGASIVALQEVHSSETPGDGNAALNVLAAETGLLAVPGPLRGQATNAFGNAVLTATPPLAVRKIDLAFKQREPRGALDVDLMVGDARVRVLATHLGLAPGERRHQVKALLSVLDPAQQDVTIILGDLNEWFVWGRPLRWLQRRFGRSPHVRTWPSRLPLFALDRIWVSPSDRLVRVSALRSGEAPVASDHLPLVATVDPRRPTAPPPA